MLFTSEENKMASRFASRGYRKIPIINLGLILFKRLFGGLIYGENYFRLIIEGNFAFRNGLGLTIKNSLKH